MLMNKTRWRNETSAYLILPIVFLLATNIQIVIPIK